MCGRAACSLAPECVSNDVNNKLLQKGGRKTARWAETPSTPYEPRFNAGPMTCLPVLRMCIDSEELAHLPARDLPSPNAQPEESSPASPAAKSEDDSDQSKAASHGSDNLIIQSMRWGLAPSFSKDPKQGLGGSGTPPFNARAESVLEKPTFKHLVSRKRCAVLMQGFYEWEKIGGKKQPYLIRWNKSRTESDMPMLALAGLYDVWKDKENPSEPPLYSFTILTVDSSKRLQWLHDRMPVILPDYESIMKWIDVTGSDASSSSSSSRSSFTSSSSAAASAFTAASVSLDHLVKELCKPYNGEDLEYYKVTPAMGNTAYDEPDCIKPIAEKSSSGSSSSSAANGKGTLHKFFSSPAKPQPVKAEKQPEKREREEATDVKKDGPQERDSVKKEDESDLKKPKNSL